MNNGKTRNKKGELPDNETQPFDSLEDVLRRLEWDRKKCLSKIRSWVEQGYDTSVTMEALDKEHEQRVKTFMLFETGVKVIEHLKGKMGQPGEDVRNDKIRRIKEVMTQVSDNRVSLRTIFQILYERKGSNTNRISSEPLNNNNVENDDDVILIQWLQHPIEMNCIICGQELDEKADYCPNCKTPYYSSDDSGFWTIESFEEGSLISNDDEPDPMEIVKIDDRVPRTDKDDYLVDQFNQDIFSLFISIRLVQFLLNRVPRARIIDILGKYERFKWIDENVKLQLIGIARGLKRERDEEGTIKVTKRIAQKIALEKNIIQQLFVRVFRQDLRMRPMDLDLRVHSTVLWFLSKLSASDILSNKGQSLESFVIRMYDSYRE